MTAGLKKIEAKLGELSPESTRYQVLAAVRAFRSSWVELGRLLDEIIHGGDYQDWGYEKFEIYCSRELGLKMPTVQKLLVSYNYMKTRAPKYLARNDGGGYDVPDYQTVGLLDKISQSKRFTPEERETYHNRAFAPWENSDTEETEAANPRIDETALRKEIRSRINDRYADSADAPENARKRELAQIKAVANRMRELLSRTDVIAAKLKDRLEEALCEIEQITLEPAAR